MISCFIFELSKSSAGLGGVGGFLTTRKKKKKKDESKVSRKQLIELIEKAQVDEALPALAALKPAAAAIAGAAARYGPTIWSGLKGLGSYFVVDKGLDYLAGDDEPKKNKPVDPETKAKIDQNLGKEIQKQQDLSKRAS